MGASHSQPQSFPAVENYAYTSLRHELRWLTSNDVSIKVVDMNFDNEKNLNLLILDYLRLYGKPGWKKWLYSARIYVALAAGFIIGLSIVQCYLNRCITVYWSSIDVGIPHVHDRLYIVMMNDAKRIRKPLIEGYFLDTAN